MKIELHKLLPFYKFAIEQAMIGIHAINQDGQTILYNEKMKKIEGLELKDIQDRSLLELFNFNQEESTLLKVLQSGKELLNVKQTYWNRNGTEITTINNTYPIFDGDECIGAIELARDVTALEKLMHQPLRKVHTPVIFDDLIAESDEMKSVISTAKKATKTKLPVLLIGETGTGKDLLAESIHNEISPTNELFYTLYCQHADSEKFIGIIEDLKNNSSTTIYCERIDLLSIPLQQKLLATLSDFEFPDRQFIASIGDDPVELIASGKLLKDLYYFFASFTIRIPPLRKRKTDILPFIKKYLDRRSDWFGSGLIGISPEVEELFLSYQWPGNVRELEFLLNEITSIATTETTISVDMLPLHFRMKSNELLDESNDAQDFIVQTGKDFLPLDEFLHEAEVYYLEKMMKLHDQNVTRTANALGMSRQSLQYRLRKIKK